METRWCHIVANILIVVIDIIVIIAIIDVVFVWVIKKFLKHCGTEIVFYKNGVEDCRLNMDSYAAIQKKWNEYWFAKRNGENVRVVAEVHELDYNHEMM